MAKDNSGATIIYDGECPFCSNYTQMVKLKEQLGNVQLLDARSSHDLITRAEEQGYDLNEGMLFIVNDEFYHGADAVRMIAHYSEPRGLFNNINKWLFRYKTFTKILYPILRFGRNLTLKALGKKPISPRH